MATGAGRVREQRVTHPLECVPAVVDVRGPLVLGIESEPVSQRTREMPCASYL